MKVCILICLDLTFSRYIDEGYNPELFTRDQLEQSLADYNAVQQKVQAYKVIIGASEASPSLGR